MEHFSARIRQTPAPLGTIISTDSVPIADLLAGCDFDWLFLDAEHGSLTLDGLQDVLVVAQGRVPALVRIPEGQDIWIKKALDAGADGIIVPQVNSAAHAASVVASAKYPPLGARSVGIGRAHRYGNGFGAYLETANNSTTVVVQVEHRDAVDNIKEIVNVEGVDAVFIGPYDLSGSLGCIGDISNSQVQEAIATVRSACSEANMPVGIFALNTPGAKACLDAGYDFVAVGIDLALLDVAARQVVNDLR